MFSWVRTGRFYRLLLTLESFVVAAVIKSLPALLLPHPDPLMKTQTDPSPLHIYSGKKER